MDLSLSVVLPVHNAESTLERNVSELLDVLPEIAARFEILIVDDGSTDHTEELAYELAREYPQVRVVRHGQRLGSAAALQTGMNHTLGDVVFVHDEASPIRATELRTLWNMRFDEELIAARAEPRHQAASCPARGLPPTWGKASQTSWAAPGLRGTQMIRRRGLDELALLEDRAEASRHVRLHTRLQRLEPAAIG